MGNGLYRFILRWNHTATVTWTPRRMCMCTPQSASVTCPHPTKAIFLHVFDLLSFSMLDAGSPAGVAVPHSPYLAIACRAQL